MKKQFKTGDRIKFKAATRDSFCTATRVVRDIDNQRRPLVSFAGWRDFIVYRREIIDVLRAR